MWRTKGSDFESLVYVSGLVFQTQHLNLTSDYHLETWRHLLSRSLQPETLPSHPQSLLDSSRLGATQFTLGATHFRAPLNTHYTFNNLPRPLSAHYHAYNNPQQLLVLTKHEYYTKLLGESLAYLLCIHNWLYSLYIL